MLPLTLTIVLSVQPADALDMRPDGPAVAIITIDGVEVKRFGSSGRRPVEDVTVRACKYLAEGRIVRCRKAIKTVNKNRIIQIVQDACAELDGR